MSESKWAAQNTTLNMVTALIADFKRCNQHAKWITLEIHPRLYTRLGVEAAYTGMVTVPAGVKELEIVFGVAIRIDETFFGVRLK